LAQLVVHHAYRRLANSSSESTKNAGLVGYLVYKKIDYSTSTLSSTMNRCQHLLLGWSLWGTLSLYLLPKKKVLHSACVQHSKLSLGVIIIVGTHIIVPYT
jgi:hypothetical protein